jgi:creatinine amidohydrolase
MPAMRILLTISLVFSCVSLVHGQTPDTVSLQELTWDEVRDALKAGTTRVIVPTGGTEQNGLHVMLGKHNVVVKHTAERMARKLGNTLVAPVLEYVPEGDPNNPNFGSHPGVISCPGACFTTVLEYASRSLKAGGFKEILLIGDSGGNQAGLQEVATKLNKEWDGSGVRVYALNEYYTKGREYHRAWLLAEFGYDEATVGSHAGITGTSQVLFVSPTGVRREKIFTVQDNEGSDGDPRLATAAIGKMIVEFKVNAGIAQYRALTSPRRQQ